MPELTRTGLRAREKKIHPPPDLPQVDKPIHCRRLAYRNPCNGGSSVRSQSKRIGLAKRTKRTPISPYAAGSVAGITSGAIRVKVIKTPQSHAGESLKTSDKGSIRKSKTRPKWDNTITDQTQYTLTTAERVMRSRSRISKHNILIFPPAPLSSMKSSIWSGTKSNCSSTNERTIKKNSTKINFRDNMVCRGRLDYDFSNIVTPANETTRNCNELDTIEKELDIFKCNIEKLESEVKQPIAKSMSSFEKHIGTPSPSISKIRPFSQGKKDKFSETCSVLGNPRNSSLLALEAAQKLSKIEKSLSKLPIPVENIDVYFAICKQNLNRIEGGKGLTSAELLETVVLSVFHIAEQLTEFILAHVPQDKTDSIGSNCNKIEESLCGEHTPQNKYITKLYSEGEQGNGDSNEVYQPQGTHTSNLSCQAKHITENPSVVYVSPGPSTMESPQETSIKNSGKKSTVACEIQSISTPNVADKFNEEDDDDVFYTPMMFSASAKNLSEFASNFTNECREKLSRAGRTCGTNITSSSNRKEQYSKVSDSPKNCSRSQCNRDSPLELYGIEPEQRLEPSICCSESSVHEQNENVWAKTLETMDMLLRREPVSSFHTNHVQQQKYIKSGNIKIENLIEDLENVNLHNRKKGILKGSKNSGEFVRGLPEPSCLPLHPLKIPQQKLYTSKVPTQPLKTLLSPSKKIINVQKKPDDYIETSYNPLRDLTNFHGNSQGHHLVLEKYGTSTTTPLKTIKSVPRNTLKEYTNHSVKVNGDLGNQGTSAPKYKDTVLGEENVNLYSKTPKKSPGAPLGVWCTPGSF